MTDLRRPGRLTLLLALLTVGCAQDNQPAQVDVPTATRDTVAGVERVHISGTPTPWTADTLATIGSSQSSGAPTAEEFGRITSVALGPDGMIYVADAINHEIRVFDGAGDHVRSFGREGQGPGEFGGIYSMAWLDRTLLTLDFTLGRIGEWNLDGEWQGQRTIPGRISGGANMIRFYNSASGTPYNWSLVADEGRSRRVFVEQTPEGPGEVLEQQSLPPDSPPSLVQCQFPGGIHFDPIPFTPQLVQTPAGDGLLAVSDGVSYRVAWVDTDGDTVRILERDAAPEPVTDEEWETGIQPFEEFQQGNPSADCTPAGMERPESKPAVTGLGYDVAGNLWVETWRDGGQWLDVYDPDLSPVRTVPAFQQSTAAPFLNNTEAVAVGTDALDVPFVHLIRFNPPPG